MTTSSDLNGLLDGGDKVAEFSFKSADLDSRNPMAVLQSQTATTMSATRNRATTIPCCLCGYPIHPNAANQCGACLAQQYDLKAALNRGSGGNTELEIHQCRECRRFERHPGKYEPCDMESPELMSLCLKHIPALQPGNHGASSATGSSGIDNIKVVDASWVWTEPHSMRLRLKLTIRAGVVDGTVQIQQALMVTFIIKFQQCPDCKREYTSRTWQAVVQLRQKRSDGSPRKGIFLAEMAIRNSKELRKHILKFETTRHGFDFYFLQLHQAQHFAQSLSKVAPMRIKTSSKLMSTDNHSNTANIKYTISCDMVPFGRDDLIVASRHGTGGDNGMGKLSGTLALVTKCKSLVHLVNAAPSRTSMIENTTELNPDKYWKTGEEKSFRILLSPNRMVRFIVLDIELCGNDNHSNDSDAILYEGPKSGVEKYALADVQVVREADFGVNDETYQCVTHLGHLLQAGDAVLGYDLNTSTDSSDILENMNQYFHNSFTMPDVVLVRKVTGNETSNEDGDGQINNDGGGKSKAKSSASKKRERRKKREEKKMLDLEKAASRMGLLPDADDSGETGKDEMNQEFLNEQKAFEEELAKDSELGEDLRMAQEAIQHEILDEEDSIVTEEAAAQASTIE